MCREAGGRDEWGFQGALRRDVCQRVLHRPVGSAGAPSCHRARPFHRPALRPPLLPSGPHTVRQSPGRPHRQRLPRHAVACRCVCGAARDAAQGQGYVGEHGVGVLERQWRHRRWQQLPSPRRKALQLGGRHADSCVCVGRVSAKGCERDTEQCDDAFGRLVPHVLQSRRGLSQGRPSRAPPHPRPRTPPPRPLRRALVPPRRRRGPVAHPHRRAGPVGHGRRAQGVGVDQRGGHCREIQAACLAAALQDAAGRVEAARRQVAEPRGT
mmetsp:Transcript_64726/g.141002  ORF Transcript_64726/g.141002 Transcript_64726/m.141002 type:complete len:268 (+) Transcript_64726:594-1397(+)